MSTPNLNKTGVLLHQKLWWLLAFALTFLLPWAIAIGSVYALERWFPGQVETDHWRILSSASFIAGGTLAAIMLFRLKKALAPRIFGASLVLLGALWFAFMFQLRSKCGDESVYIGTKPGIQVATCG